VVIESVREVGGRELLKIPMQWPPTDRFDAEAQGESELGRVQLRISP
jgi:hypothetical protein